MRTARYRKLRTDNDVRTYLEKVCLKRPIADGVWAELCDGGEVEQIRDAPCEADRDEAEAEAVRRIRTLEDRFDRSAPRTQRRTVRTTDGKSPPTKETWQIADINRTVAVLCALAAEARAYPPLVTFRDEVLSGRLVAPEDVGEWIIDHSDRHGDASRSGRSQSILRYFWWIDGVDHLSTTAVHPGNEPLIRLKEVADILVQLCFWEEEQAVNFALTEDEPLLSITVDTRTRHFLPVGAHREIILTIPVWASDDDVLDVWRHARRQQLNVLGVTRLNKMSEKWACVAFFVYRRLDAKGKPIGGWEPLWKEWNRFCDDIDTPD